MQSFSKPVSHSLILLWSHERGELSNKSIPSAAAHPMGALVDKAGAVLDPAAPEWDPTQAYGIHMQYGQVYWAHSVFNSEYVIWPDGITSDDKQAVIDHLETTFLIIK